MRSEEKILELARIVAGALPLYTDPHEGREHDFLMGIATGLLWVFEIDQKDQKFKEENFPIIDKKGSLDDIIDNMVEEIRKKLDGEDKKEKEEKH